MALKTFVKVGNISNLSDARYCAGMGVDLLGFNGIEGQPGYIPTKLYQDIRGWVAGPLAVLELYGLKASGSLGKLLEDYRPDYIELGSIEFEFLPESISQPLIVRITSFGELSKLQAYKGKISFILVDEKYADIIEGVSTFFPVILSLQSPVGISLLDTLPIKGVALSGGAEIRPGFKDYDGLAEVLEQLEVD
jgi:phosphoribosylanthranilate isomerase